MNYAASHVPGTEIAWLRQDFPHRVLDRLNNKVQSGCSVCGWKSTLEILHHRIVQDLRLSRVSNSALSGICPSCVLLAATLDYVVGGDYSKIDRFYCKGESISFVIQRKAVEVEIFVLEENTELPNQSLLPIRRIPPEHSSSQESLDWTCNWLDCCDTNHEYCGAGNNGTLPGRVIDVSPGENLAPGDVRLIDQAQRLPRDRYITLSHCWGQVVPQCITTQETFDENQKCIPFDSMPKTFQDAVLFTRLLSIRYLWIDSLCIIQNSEDDWKQEAGLMAQVYGNSYLTLAAVHAKDCTQGLYHKDSGKHKSHQLPEITLGETTIKPYARRILPAFHSWNQYSLGECHALFERAWAYQERLVAPRVVYFTENELLWECFQSASCECLGSAPTSRQSARHMPALTKIDHWKSLSSDKVAQRWRAIVTEYSRLRLTKFRDKLPAISAVAKQVQQHRLADTYLFGLWRNTLMIDLLWRRQFPGIYNKRLPALRPVITSAPTWSWASITENVEYSPLINDEEVEVETATLMDPPFNYNGSGDDSQSQPGKLVLHCKMAQCSLKTGKSKCILSHKSAGDFTFYPYGCELDCSYLDKTHNGNTMITVSTTKIVYLVCIRQSSSEISCLILRKSSKEPVYQRIGMVMRDNGESGFEKFRKSQTKEMMRMKSIFSNVQKSEVTIE
jgi:hypothetical protein